MDIASGMQAKWDKEEVAGGYKEQLGICSLGFERRMERTQNME